MTMFFSGRAWKALAGATLALAFVTDANADILVEGRLNDRSLRIEIGPDPTRVQVAIDGIAHLVDIDRQKIYRIDGDRWHLVEDDSAAVSQTDDGYELQDWGHGPPIAGHGSRLNVLSRGDRLCAEVLASAWMTPFLIPAVEAMDVLIDEMSALRPATESDCGLAPFAALAANGWPLLIGWQDSQYFATESIRFDYDPPTPAAAPSQ